MSENRIPECVEGLREDTSRLKEEIDQWEKNLPNPARALKIWGVVIGGAFGWLSMCCVYLVMDLRVKTQAVIINHQNKVIEDLTDIEQQAERRKIRDEVMTNLHKAEHVCLTRGEVYLARMYRLVCLEGIAILDQIEESDHRISLTDTVRHEVVDAITPEQVAKLANRILGEYITDALNLSKKGLTDQQGSEIQRLRERLEQLKSSALARR